MRRKLLVCLMTALYVVIMLGCQSNESLDQEFGINEQNDIGNQIKKNLVAIIENKEFQASSNPNDYIKGNPRLYEDIISTGDKGFEFLVNELKKSNEDGLKEWIMAKACEDIVKDEQQVNGWSTGKEWLEKYERLKK